MCSCPGYQYRHRCKHVTHTPKEASTLKREATKAGKQVITGLKDNPAYGTPEEKMANDPQLKSFMEVFND